MSRGWNRSPEKLREAGARIWDSYLLNPKQCGLVKALYAAQGGSCARCGSLMLRGAGNSPDGLSLDHVRPLGRGGLDLPGNLVLMHRRCNTEKGNNPPHAPDLAMLETVNGVLGWKTVVRWEDYYGRNAA